MPSRPPKLQITPYVQNVFSPDLPPKNPNKGISITLETVTHFLSYVRLETGPLVPCNESQIQQR